MSVKKSTIGLLKGMADSFLRISDLSNTSKISYDLGRLEGLVGTKYN